MRSWSLPFWLVMVLISARVTVAQVMEGPFTPKSVIALLELPWQEKISDEKLDQAAAQLKPVADEAVEEIMRAFNRSDQQFAYRHRAVQILQRLETKQARAALLDIALGRSAEGLPSMKQWASAAYLHTTQDNSEVRKLLASDDSGVLGNVLRAIKGAKLDETLLKQLLELTAYRADKGPMGQELVRNLAATALSADPGGEFVVQKVDAILAAAGKVAGLEEANKIAWPSSYTRAEASYLHYMRCLTEMRGADEVLRRTTGRAAEPVADLLVIARAQRGDAAVRKELLRILDDQRKGMWRAWAADGLAVIGTADDVPILKKLAASDPFQRDSGGCLAPPGGQNNFPVREAARRAMLRIGTRPGGQP